VARGERRKTERRMETMTMEASTMERQAEKAAQKGPVALVQELAAKLVALAVAGATAARGVLRESEPVAVPQIQGPVVAQAAVKRLGWLARVRRAVVAAFDPLSEAAGLLASAVAEAKAAAVADLDGEIDALGGKLLTYWEGHKDTLPEGKRDRLEKGGTWGKGSGLRIGTGKLVVDDAAAKALVEVATEVDGLWEAPTGEQALALVTKLAPHWPAAQAVVANIAEAQAAEGVGDPAAAQAALAELLGLVVVERRISATAAKDYLDAKGEAAGGTALKLVKSATLVVDGMGLAELKGAAGK